MKNMKLIIMACLLVLLAACGSKPAPKEDKQNGAPQAAENDIPAEEAGVKAEVKLEDGSDEGKLTLINRSGTEAGTGTAYVLEKWEDGEWEKMNNDQMFTEQMIMIKAGENYDQTLELKEQEEGTYRVTKEFFEKEEKHQVAVVFEKK